MIRANERPWPADLQEREAFYDDEPFASEPESPRYGLLVASYIALMVGAVGLVFVLALVL